MSTVVFLYGLIVTCLFILVGVLLCVLVGKWLDRIVRQMIYVFAGLILSAWGLPTSAQTVEVPATFEWEGPVGERVDNYDKRLLAKSSTFVSTGQGTTATVPSVLKWLSVTVKVPSP